MHTLVAEPVQRRMAPALALFVSSKTMAKKPSAFSLQEVRFGRHETVFHVNETANRYFQVLDGGLMLYQLLEDGRRQVVEIVLPGGLVGFARSGVHQATCETLVATGLRFFLRAEVESSAVLRAQVGIQAENQLCALHDHILALGRKTAEERVAALLSLLAKMTISPDGERAVCLDLPMTRGEMADHLGLSLETVCRTLSGLQAQGVLTVGKKRGEVILKKPRRLRQLAALASDDRSSARHAPFLQVQRAGQL